MNAYPDKGDDEVVKVSDVEDEPIIIDDCE